LPSQVRGAALFARVVMLGDSRIGGQDSGDQSAASSGHHSPRLRSRICREVAAKYANWHAVVIAPPPSNLPSSDPTHAE